MGEAPVRREGKRREGTKDYKSRQLPLFGLCLLLLSLRRVVAGGANTAVHSVQRVVQK